MAKAWQVRNRKRQELIYNLMKIIYEEEDRLERANLSVRNFRLDLIMAIASFLKYDFKRDILNELRETRFFHYRVLWSIDDFARLDSEWRFLMLNLLKKVTIHIAQESRDTLQGDALHNPQKIFNAPSAMAEVPLEDE